MSRVVRNKRREGVASGGAALQPYAGETLLDCDGRRVKEVLWYWDETAVTRYEEKEAYDHTPADAYIDNIERVPADECIQRTATGSRAVNVCSDEPTLTQSGERIYPYIISSDSCVPKCFDHGDSHQRCYDPHVTCHSRPSHHTVVHEAPTQGQSRPPAYVTRNQ